MEKHTAIAKGWRKRQIMIKEPEDEAFEEIEKAQQQRKLLVDKGCAERGCMGYDDRDGDKPVEMRLMNEPAHWATLIRGVRVEGDTVVITVKGGNHAARCLCGELINEMEMSK
jgi:hypothetical protein